MNLKSWSTTPRSSGNVGSGAERCKPQKPKNPSSWPTPDNILPPLEGAILAAHSYLELIPGRAARYKEPNSGIVSSNNTKRPAANAEDSLSHKYFVKYETKDLLKRPKHRERRKIALR